MQFTSTLCLSLTLSLFTPTAGLAASTVSAPQAAPKVTSAHALVGTWRATGGDQEALEFRADGTLVFNGGELRYSTRGSRLVLEADGERVEGTWRVTDGELTLTLRRADGGSATDRYRRVEPAATRAAVGRASFVLPTGWTIAHREGDLALINAGFAATDTLDALVVVASATLEGVDLNRTVTALLEAHLPALATDLRGQAVEVQHLRAKVTALALPKLAGAEVTLAGRAGGERPVTVWVGMARDATASATVLAVVLRGQEDEFVPGARRILESVEFAAADPVSTGDGTVSGLAGLEFGSSTFGSDSSLTTAYRFAANGSVTRRTMFSSPFGGTDSEADGTFVQRGDSVTIRVDGETFEATVERRGGEVSALRIGSAVHRRM